MLLEHLNLKPMVRISPLALFLFQFQTVFVMSALDEKKEADLATGPGTDVAPSPSSSSVAEAVGINEKSLLRKLDYRLLPPLTLLYLLSFLDRSNGSLP